MRERRQTKKGGVWYGLFGFDLHLPVRKMGKCLEPTAIPQGFVRFSLQFSPKHSNNTIQPQPNTQDRREWRIQICFYLYYWAAQRFRPSLLGSDSSTTQNSLQKDKFQKFEEPQTSPFSQQFPKIHNNILFPEFSSSYPLPLFFFFYILSFLPACPFLAMCVQWSSFRWCAICPLNSCSCQ